MSDQTPPPGDPNATNSPGIETSQGAPLDAPQQGSPTDVTTSPEGAGNVQELPQPGDLKSLSEVAREVVEGKWGIGQDRRNRLHAAGYDFREVDVELRRLRNS